MADLEGTRLGSCMLLQRIGRGGMGEVYLAEQAPLGRRVAVKVIRASLRQGDPTAAARAGQRFIQEARALAALEHPHILPLYEYGEQEDVAYLVTPYIADGSLADVLAPGPRQRLSLPLAPALIAQIVAQASDALAYAHARGVIHCDIKPSNLLVRPVLPPNGAASGPLGGPLQVQVFLSDFGLARFLEQGETSNSRAAGTPLYYAPEQYAGQPGPASDQYALACVVYLLLTGQPVFSGTVAELHRQHLLAPPPPPSLLNPAIAPALDAALLRALAKQPGARFPDVTTFAQAVQAALPAPSIQATPPAPWQGMPPAQYAASVAPTEPNTPDPAVSYPMGAGAGALGAAGAAEAAQLAVSQSSYQAAAIASREPDGAPASLPLEFRMRSRLGRLGVTASPRQLMVAALIAALLLVSIGGAVGGSALLGRPIGRAANQAPTATAPLPTATVAPTTTPSPTVAPTATTPPTPTATPGPDGCAPGLVVVEKEGSQLVTYTCDSTTRWRESAAFGDGIQSAPSAALDGQGQLNVVARRNGALARYWRDAQGHWNGPETFGATETSAPSLAYNGAGLDVVTREGSQIAHYYRDNQGWHLERVFGDSVSGDVSVTFNRSNSVLEVVAIHSGQAGHYAYRVTTAGVHYWSGPIMFGDTNVTYTGLSIDYNSNSVLPGPWQVVATENGQLVYYTGTYGGGTTGETWQRVSATGSGVQSGPAVKVNRSTGNLEVVAQVSGRLRYYALVSGPANPIWSGPQKSFGDGGVSGATPGLAIGG